jgi:hypothetical protein
VNTFARPARLDIEWVMKGGVLYDADTLDEIWPRERPYGAYPWADSRIFPSDDRPVEYWDREEQKVSRPLPRSS